MTSKAAKNTLFTNYCSTKINDPPPAFSWTRMNRDRRAPGVRHKISPAKYLQICEMYWTLHMGLQYMRWLSGLLPTSRQLMKLNHLQHSRHLTSTRVCDWCQVQSTFYTHLHFTRLMHGHSFMWDMNSTLTFVDLDSDMIVHCCGCFETYVRATLCTYWWCMYWMIREFLEMSTGLLLNIL